jgi:acetylglutamate kinase
MKVKILVHGGIQRQNGSMGLVPQMIDGRRITDAPMLDVAVMIYAGQINKKYCGSITSA